jgi:hypothetical protein
MFHPIVVVAERDMHHNFVGFGVFVPVLSTDGSLGDCGLTVEKWCLAWLS